MVFSPKGLQKRRHRVQGLQTASPRGRGVRRGLRAEPHRGIHGEPSENYGKLWKIAIFNGKTHYFNGNPWENDVEYGRYNEATSTQVTYNWG